MEDEATEVVGTIPADVKNIYIRVTADQDVDLEIWDGENPVLSFDDDMPSQFIAALGGSWNYQSLIFSYSGYYGVNNNDGDEWITIEGSADREYTIKVASYDGDTTATVNYSWGNIGISSGWIK